MRMKASRIRIKWDASTEKWRAYKERGTTISRFSIAANRDLDKLLAGLRIRGERHA